MSWYLLEPREPLTLPPGSPIQIEPQADRSLGFPPPAELAGLLRARLRLERQGPDFGRSERAAAFVQVRGPLLCDLDGGAPRVLAPTARDALGLAALRIRFRAKEYWEPRQAEGRPGGPGSEEAGPAVTRRLAADLALDHGPAFWSARALRSWLEDFHQEAAPLVVEEGFATIDRHPAMAGEGASEAMPERLVGDRSSFRKWRRPQVERLGLLVWCEEPDLRPGLVVFGPDRRLARLSRASMDPTWPAPVLKGSEARIVLLTPGVFDGEDGPDQIAGARVNSWFACKARWGTDGGRGAGVGAGGGEGGSRRPRCVLGAGTALTVSLEGLDPAEWVARVHFQEISSRAEDRRDGFGLAVVGR